MKRIKLNFNLLFAIFLLLACNTKNDLPEYIEGYVVERESRAPVPNSYVVTYKEISDLWNSQYEMVDTLRSDANGRFRLDRQKYIDINEDCKCSFVVCGRGPGTAEGYEFYEDRCDMSYLNIKTDAKVYCSTQLMGYLRVYVEDVEPFNPEYHFVDCIVNNGTSSESGRRIYPNPDYNSAQGVLFGAFYDHTQLAVRLVFSDINGYIHELEQNQNAQIKGKEIVNLYFQY